MVTLSKWLTTQIRRGVKNLAVKRSDEIAFEVASLDAQIGDEETTSLGEILPLEAPYAQDPIERMLEQARIRQDHAGHKFALQVQTDVGSRADSFSVSLASIVSVEALAERLTLQSALEGEAQSSRIE